MANQHASNRRDFLLAATTVLSVHTSLGQAERHPAPLASGSISVQETIDRILEEVPGDRVSNSVDTVKSGDPSQTLTGIATTFLATCDVIERTRATGANLLITHEPTFYNHRDEVDWLEADPIYQYKRKLLADSQIVVWRFHDYWHRITPDPVTAALQEDLGLKGAAMEVANVLTIDPTPLDELARSFKDRLDLSLVRTIGDPNLNCRRVGLLAGAWGARAQIGLWARERVDVLVCGEINEWETNIYLADAVSAGHRTGLIILGHVNTEEPGMRALAEWLRPRFPEAPIQHIPMGDPFRYL